MRWYVPSMLPNPLYGRSPGEAVHCCSLDSRLNKMPPDTVCRRGERRQSQDLSPAVPLCRRQQAWRGQQPLSAPMFAPNPLQNTQAC